MAIADMYVCTRVNWISEHVSGGLNFDYPVFASENTKRFCEK